MKLRKATQDDIDATWEIFSQVISKGDTYVFDENTSKNDFERLWFAATMQTFVAEEDGAIVGTYFLKPNQPGRGNHIANASYIVKPGLQGKGIGQMMCEHSINVAHQLDFQAIQFNLVVSTNDRAVSLWKKNGFKIVGTIPKAFRHAREGFVDAHIMYLSLADLNK